MHSAYFYKLHVYYFKYKWDFLITFLENLKTFPMSNLLHPNHILPIKSPRSSVIRTRKGYISAEEYTTSSNNHSGVPQYEEEDSEFDESSMPNIDIDQEFRNLSKSFGFSFGGFNDIFRELEEIQRDMQINTPFRPHFTQNPQDFQQSTRNPRDFQQSTSKTQPSQKDTNIYDI